MVVGGALDRSLFPRRSVPSGGPDQYPTNTQHLLALQTKLDRPGYGGEGNRTPDLVNAIHALSQLSYAPPGIHSHPSPAPFPSTPSTPWSRDPYVGSVPQSAEWTPPPLSFRFGVLRRGTTFGKHARFFATEPLNVSVCMSGVNRVGLAKILSADNLHDFSVHAQETRQPRAARARSTKVLVVSWWQESRLLDNCGM